MHISHDMHRFVGWCESTDIHLTGHLARQLGSMTIPETDEERRVYDSVRQRYWYHYHSDGVDRFKNELKNIVEKDDEAVARFVFTDAAAIWSPRIASRLYPQFFESESSLVDKDGLTTFRALTSETTEIQPGVFLDAKRNLVLFAHPFFRRNLSRINSLNSYFLGSFAEYVRSSPLTDARLRLDPDLIGHGDSVRERLELEYWRGPHFRDDIENIQCGVAEHKADERLRYFESIDKTQLWWKSPENRESARGRQFFRTFEVEELVDDPSIGLDGEKYGCRYSHAEYDIQETLISHFDGAIRAYAGDEYLSRIDKPINRAGKHSEYTKLFRLDSSIPVSSWKQLLTNFFRGNTFLSACPFPTRREPPSIIF